MKLRGKAWKYGDNVDTDVIIPARYLNTADAAELAKHCMEDLDAKFASAVQKGDMIVAGANFGCGSSREHAPISIKATGVSCVIARSFARIFFRNAINTGLPVFECSDAANDAEKGNELEVNTETGEIKNLSRNKTYPAAALPESIQQIIDAGGLMGYVKKRMGA